MVSPRCFFAPSRDAGAAGKVDRKPAWAQPWGRSQGKECGMERFERLLESLVTAGRLSLSGDLHASFGWAQEAVRLAEESHLFMERELSLLRAAEAQVRHVTAYDLAYGEGVYPLPWAAEVFRRAAKVVGAFLYCRGDEEAGLLARARLVAMAAGEDAYKRGYC